MKNILKGLLLFVIIAGLSLLMPGLMDSTEYDAQAGEAEWSSEGSDGTIEPFTVVELVPYKGMGEIGYLVGSQEPVDQELMSTGTAGGALSFLGGAIDVYNSYEEKPSSAFGAADSGWRPAKKEIVQNGYFERVGHSNGGLYSLVNYNTQHYERVADGAGNYIAVPTTMDATYDLWAGDITNKRNVNAYFVYGKPSGVTLFNGTVGYTPASVTENPTHNGDYNYDIATESFYLNQGNGRYDILFERAYSGNMYYIMQNNLEVVDDGTGMYSFSMDYQRVSAGRGNYVSVTDYYFRFDQYNGEYRFTQDDTALTKSTNDYYDDGHGKYWVKNQRLTVPIQFHYNVQLVNNEWFKTKTLGIPADMAQDYPVQVITITPENLTPDIINKADLFYVNANYGHNHTYVQNYELYNNEGRSLPASEKYEEGTKNEAANLNFVWHDLSWDSVIQIFKRAAGIGCNKAAMIFDIQFYLDAVKGQGEYSRLYQSVSVPNYSSYNSNGATMCNMAKLYIMVYQRNMVDFYNAFLQTTNTNIGTKLITKENTTVNKSGTTGSFIRPDMTYLRPTDTAAMYWNGNTFLPFGLNSTGNMVQYATQYNTAALTASGIVNYNMTANTTDLTNNVLTLNGMDIFTAKFVQPLDIPDDSDEEAIVHLSSLDGDGTLVTSFTIGDLANVITNNGGSFDNVGGVSYPAGGDVEGVPVSDPGSGTVGDGDDGSGSRSYKRVLNIEPTADFTASEAAIRAILYGYSVQIVNVTSTQFNGTIADINSMYDMIYIGTGAGRFNMSSNRTDFNDGDLDQQYYFTDGDFRPISDHDWSSMYTGNDITAQRFADLLSYLDAGYPVVLDHDIYDGRGTSYADNLPALLHEETRHKNNLLNAADFSSTNTSTKLTFKSRLKTALNVVRPVINLIAPTIPEGSEVDYVYSSNNILTILFKFQGSRTSGYTYDAHLYVDENSDGIFDASEEADITLKGDSTTTNLRESLDWEYKYEYNLTGLNGVYQWKLEVRRSDNTDGDIRSIVTGYVANSNKQNIYILHIRDDAAAYSLQSKINDAGSFVYQYAGDNKLQDYNLIVKTLTVQEFQNLYAAQKYTTATAAQTDKLSRYHLLILDNPLNTISNTNGARTNIYDEINGGMSVVFTKNAINNDNESYYYPSAATSFLTAYTYNWLNQHAYITSTYKYYIYRNFLTPGNAALSSANAYLTNSLTKTNEGTITRYPYQINQAINCATNSYSDYVTKDFNLSGQKLIGWYCLSDDKSPVVNTNVSTSDIYRGMYSSSPNDVKNNYYLFSYGLCYYSGINLNTADNAVTGSADEIKLFVNTIIAAYKASPRKVSIPPVITITDPVPVDEPPVELDGTYYIRNVTSGLVMEVAGSSTGDSIAIQQNTATGAENQKFKIVSDGNGYYYIYTGSSGYTKVVDVYGESAADGTNIIQYTFHNGLNQLFEIVPVSGGKYAIKTRITGSASCLDNNTGSTAINIPIKQYRYTITGVDHQLWYLEPAIDEDVVYVSEIKDGMFNLTFDITESSSNMDMAILLNNAEAAGSWDDTIYKKTGETIGPPISIHNTNKAVSNGTYVLKIPEEYVVENNVLNFTVTNSEGSRTLKNVRMRLMLKPVVTITYPVPIMNDDVAYLYVDIDYNAVDTSEDYLNTAEDLEVKFTVEKSVTDYTLSIASKEGDLTGYDIKVIDEDGNEVDLTQPCPKDNKDYTMYIPVAIMKGLNSREITITATDTLHNPGEASVTLIRRSLFSLD